MRARLQLIQTVAAEVASDTPLACEHLLSGHSGARVVLHSSGGDSFVRKTAAGWRRWTGAAFRKVRAMAT